MALRSLKIVAIAIARPLRRTIPRGLLDNTVFDRIRLGFYLMILLGPFFAVLGWQNQQRVDDILRHGATAEASVTRTQISRGKGTAYMVDIAWRDARGTQHRVEQLSVSAAYFSQITRTNSPKVPVKYLTDRETTRRTVALTDDASWNSEGSRMIPSWLVATLLGLAGTALMTLWRNRKLRAAARMA
jgi:hypothetical protein